MNPSITGVTAYEAPPFRQVYQRAAQDIARTQSLIQARRNQSVVFKSGPVGLAFFSDQHFGSPGTNVVRAFQEAWIVRTTPRLFVFLHGDLINNFIIGRLRQARDGAKMSIYDEWVLCRLYLLVLAPKLIGIVPGNHDLWTLITSGVDFFRELVKQIKPNCLYDPYDLLFKFRVGDFEKIGRIRHTWRGYSYLNRLHGIQRAMREDQNFDFGVGGHHHGECVVGEINLGGQVKLAVKTGSYKIFDTYAMKKGYRMAAPTVGGMILFDDKVRTMTGFSNLLAGVRVLKSLTANTKKDAG